MSSVQDFLGDEDAFKAVQNTIKRGDIIGVKGEGVVLYVLYVLIVLCKCVCCRGSEDY